MNSTLSALLTELKHSNRNSCCYCIGMVTLTVSYQKVQEMEMLVHMACVRQIYQSAFWVEVNRPTLWSQFVTEELASFCQKMSASAVRRLIKTRVVN
eukprot:c27342_g2_i2 orf=891-1181(-)